MSLEMVSIYYPRNPIARVFNLPVSELHVFNFMLHIFSLNFTATIVPTIASQDFRNDSIIVTLELMTVAQNSIVTVSVEPSARAQEVLNLDPRRILLTLSYNTIYSVSTTAILCGQNASHIIELYYGKSVSNLLW